MNLKHVSISASMSVPARRHPAQPREREDAPLPRRAASQRQRLRRIVHAAVRLAEKGGFEAVRLREVADVSNVALGTLYKYFRGKQDILLYALTEELERLETAMATRPPRGRSGLERVTEFFKQATRALVGKPHFARAVLRSLAGGEPDTAARVASFHLRMTRLIVAALRGKPIELAADLNASIGTPHEREMAFILQNVWFASLVGWAGGLHTDRDVAAHVRLAADLMRIRSREE
jgi:AcrR family transcriptional regulator